MIEYIITIELLLVAITIVLFHYNKRMKKQEKQISYLLQQIKHYKSLHGHIYCKTPDKDFKIEEKR